MVFKESSSWNLSDQQTGLLSRLVSAAGVFKGNFDIIFYKIRWHQIVFERISRTLRSSATVFLLSNKLWFNPFGCSGSSIWIQKIFLSISLCRKMSFELVVFVSLSIMMNFACLLKTCFFSWKCLHANVASGFLTSLGWLHSLTLKLVSDFPTHCFLHKVHSIR